MEISLEQQIADYQQMVETTRQDGRALRHRLKQEGWEIIDSLLEFGRIPCAIPPDLFETLTMIDGISYDDEYDYSFFSEEVSDRDFERIVPLPVTD